MWIEQCKVNNVIAATQSGVYKGGTSPTLVPAVLEDIRMPLSVCGTALDNLVSLFCTGAGVNWGTGRRSVGVG